MGEMMDPREELVDLIDEQDRVIGWARRERIRRLNLLHRGVGILCLDPDGRIYVHRRTETKDVFPGMYDMFVGGVVGKGEDRDLAAAREIAEELGIEGPNPEPICRYLYLGPLNRSLVAVYKVTWEGEIRHQPEEVEWGSYMSIEEIEAKTGEWNFVPDGIEIWNHIRELKVI
tara:strand:- start:7 stop:525 length:519 start_codon:yes stop_codon:yes gene_type:complete